MRFATPDGGRAPRFAYISHATTSQGHSITSLLARTTARGPVPLCVSRPQDNRVHDDGNPEPVSRRARQRGTHGTTGARTPPEQATARPRPRHGGMRTAGRVWPSTLCNSVCCVRDGQGACGPVRQKRREAPTGVDAFNKGGGTTPRDGRVCTAHVAHSSSSHAGVSIPQHPLTRLCCSVDQRSLCPTVCMRTHGSQHVISRAQTHRRTPYAVAIAHRPPTAPWQPVPLRFACSGWRGRPATVYPVPGRVRRAAPFARTHARWRASFSILCMRLADMVGCAPCAVRLDVEGTRSGCSSLDTPRHCSRSVE